MPQHLTENEQDLIDKYVRTERKKPMEALAGVNKGRIKKGLEIVDKSTVYRYVNGKSHRRNVVETRGRAKSLSKTDETHLLKTRRRLLREAGNQKRVTHDDVHKASGLKKKACKRVVMDALRINGVRYRRPREKILITEEDAKTRNKICKVWKNKRASGQ